LHRLSSSFILGYHGCDQDVADRLLNGEPMKQSRNKYDWLGPGIYFWESNPLRGLDFARESSARGHMEIRRPAVIGAVIDLGLCLDLTTSGGIEWAQIAYESLEQFVRTAGMKLPQNSPDGLRRNLDCAVFTHLHRILEDQRAEPIDSIKGVFTEGGPVYPGAGFEIKTHVQVAVRNPACIKGVFRVPQSQLRPFAPSLR